MSAYIARRILLMIPTLLGILCISFLIAQVAPGGPVERLMAQIAGHRFRLEPRSGGGGGDLGAGGSASQSGAQDAASKYRGAQGLDQQLHGRAQQAVRFRQAGLVSAARQDAEGLCDCSISAIRSFRDTAGAGADQGEDAGVDHTRAYG
jgi:hypothetical protein